MSAFTNIGTNVFTQAANTVNAGNAAIRCRRPA